MIETKNRNQTENLSEHQMQVCRMYFMFNVKLRILGTNIFFMNINDLAIEKLK